MTEENTQAAAAADEAVEQAPAETIMVPGIGEVPVPAESQPTNVNDQITDSVTQAAPGEASSETAESSDDTSPSSTETASLSIDEQVTSEVTHVGSGEDAPAAGNTPSYDALWNALENCRLLAAKRPKEDWARNILRFCADAGVNGSVLR